MTRLLSISSYLLVAALGAVFGIAMYGHDSSTAVPSDDQCIPVLISQFGDLIPDRVCSDKDVARIYGETKLLAEQWIQDHDCDVDSGDAPDLKQMRWKR